MMNMVKRDQTSGANKDSQDIKKKTQTWNFVLSSWIVSILEI